MCGKLGSSGNSGTLHHDQDGVEEEEDEDVEDVRWVNVRILGIIHELIHYYYYYYLPCPEFVGVMWPAA